MDYSRPLCPACNERLNHSMEIQPGGKSRHAVSCGNVRCEAQPKSNDGAEGATMEEAVKKLAAAIEA